MDYIIDKQTLDSIWAALQAPVDHSKYDRAIRHFISIVKKGWVFHSDLEDLIYWLDSRLMHNGFDLTKFSKSVNIHWERVCYRPSAKSNSVMVNEALRPEEAVLLLIILEQVGFETNPTYFVDLLLPSIKSRKKKLFSNAELELFWFQKTRHKGDPILLKLEDSSVYVKELQSIKTCGNYVVKLIGDEAGNVSMLKIAAPKFRNRKRPLKVTCRECGIQWFKGDPDSSYEHRRNHKIIMAYLDPKPLPEMLVEIKIVNEPELVTGKSPEWKHHEMYERAKAFKREFHFDFIQWNNPNNSGDPNSFGFLFTDKVGAIVGACSFRDRSADYGKKIFGLEWIWICPRERRSGHLALRWKAFRERFGDFIVEAPVSDSMKGFLKKNGDSSLMDYPVKEM